MSDDEQDEEQPILHVLAYADGQVFMRCGSKLRRNDVVTALREIADALDNDAGTTIDVGLN